MIEPKFLLNNKVSLITGGGSGIGKAIAKTFVMQGSYVNILDYNEKAAAEVLLEINNEGNKSEAYKCDV
jgi:2-keto-3-deoxy-L-fuconate dehydrogenase